jgi:excisionase family DNA binding protein
MARRKSEGRRQKPASHRSWAVEGRDVTQRPPPRSFFTVEQLATRWEVSERTIRRMIKRGELRAVEIGAQRRVPVDVVEHYEAQHTTGSRP